MTPTIPVGQPPQSQCPSSLLPLADPASLADPGLGQSRFDMRVMKAHLVLARVGKAQQIARPVLLPGARQLFDSAPRQNLDDLRPRC